MLGRTTTPAATAARIPPLTPHNRPHHSLPLLSTVTIPSTATITTITSSTTIAVTLPLLPMDRFMDNQKVNEVYDLAYSDEPIAPRVREALEVIDRALDDFRFEHLALSFNGGKDCTVLLHLYAAALYRRFQKRIVIPSLYIPLPSPFPELEFFIDESIKTYDLELFHCLSTSTKTKDGVQLAIETVMTPASGIPSQPKKGGGEGMKKALEAYKSKFPDVKGILIGTRRTDPYCDKLAFRSPTDSGWPEFTRINPIIEWSYPDVWTFLKRLGVPYCSLYDQGYTSIGSTYNTFRNPALAIKTTCNGDEATPINGVQAKQEYRPAYELVDGALERAGRGRS